MFWWSFWLCNYRFFYFKFQILRMTEKIFILFFMNTEFIMPFTFTYYWYLALIEFTFIFIICLSLNTWIQITFWYINFNLFLFTKTLALKFFLYILKIFIVKRIVKYVVKSSWRKTDFIVKRIVISFLFTTFIWFTNPNTFCVSI